MAGGVESGRTQLVEQHMGLVRAIAHRYARGREIEEDLVQVGAIGLMKAIDRFDPKRGTDLRALAVPAIEGEIRHHLRDRVGAVRVPRPVRELAARARAARDELARRQGRTPTTAEVAAAVGAPEAAVADALAAGRPSVPLDAHGEDAATEDEGDVHALLTAGLDALSGRDRRIVELRFYEDRSQAEIARELDLSQAHVSRLLRRSLEQMRAALGDAAVSGAPADGDAPDAPADREPEQERAAQPSASASSHSGRMLVRMPRGLHAELARAAAQEGVSLNAFVTGALAGSVGWRAGVGAAEAEEPRAAGDSPAPAPAETAPEPPRPRWAPIVLVANLVVVVLAAAVAIALLVVATRHGW